jgi:hypothetical protein
MVVDGPADCHVNDVSSDKPCDNKYAKGNVASGSVAHVLEQLCGLSLSALATSPTS